MQLGLHSCPYIMLRPGFMEDEYLARAFTCPTLAADTAADPIDDPASDPASDSNPDPDAHYSTSK
jgi:hypothetical protein